MFDGFCRLRRTHAYDVSVNYSCAVKMASCQQNTLHNSLDLRQSKLMVIMMNKPFQIGRLVVHNDVQIFEVFYGLRHNDLVDSHDLTLFSVVTHLQMGDSSSA